MSFGQYQRGKVIQALERVRKLQCGRPHYSELTAMLDRTRDGKYTSIYDIIRDYNAFSPGTYMFRRKFVKHVLEQFNLTEKSVDPSRPSSSPAAQLPSASSTQPVSSGLPLSSASSTQPVSSGLPLSKPPAEPLIGAPASIPVVTQTRPCVVCRSPLTVEKNLHVHVHVKCLKCNTSQTFLPSSPPPPSPFLTAPNSLPLLSNSSVPSSSSSTDSFVCHDCVECKTRGRQTQLWFPSSRRFIQCYACDAVQQFSAPPSTHPPVIVLEYDANEVYLSSFTNPARSSSSAPIPPPSSSAVSSSSRPMTNAPPAVSTSVGAAKVSSAPSIVPSVTASPVVPAPVSRPASLPQSLQRPAGVQSSTSQSSSSSESARVSALTPTRVLTGSLPPTPIPNTSPLSQPLTNRSAPSQPISTMSGAAVVNTPVFGYKAPGTPNALAPSSASAVHSVQASAPPPPPTPTTTNSFKAPLTPNASAPSFTTANSVKATVPGISALPQSVPAPLSALAAYAASSPLVHRALAGSIVSSAPSPPTTYAVSSSPAPAPKSIGSSSSSASPSSSSSHSSSSSSSSAAAVAASPHPSSSLSSPSPAASAPVRETKPTASHSILSVLAKPATSPQVTASGGQLCRPPAIVILDDLSHGAGSAHKQRVLLDLDTSSRVKR